MKVEKVAKFIKSWKTIVGGAIFLYVLLIAVQTSAFDLRYVKIINYEQDKIGKIRSEIAVYEIRRDFARDDRDMEMMQAIINQKESEIKKLKGE